MILCYFFFLMIRRPPRSTLDRSSAASDVYKRQGKWIEVNPDTGIGKLAPEFYYALVTMHGTIIVFLSLIHISEPTRPY